MARGLPVQCLGCRRMISGERDHRQREYAHCDACHVAMCRRLRERIDRQRTFAQRNRASEQNFRQASRRLHFLARWGAGGGDDGHPPPPLPPHHHSGTGAAAPAPPPPPPPLSDIVLTSKEGTVIHAHKAVLAGKSPVFRAMFYSPMQERETGIVTMADLSHEVLSSFVRFFYTAAVDPETLKKHAESLFSTAHKYQVDFLMDVCERAMIKNLSVNNVLSNLELANTYGRKPLRDAIVNVAAREVHKLEYCEEYKRYSEANPHLLLNLYEGVTSRSRRKRTRTDVEAARAALLTPFERMRGNDTSSDDDETTSAPR